MTTMLRRLWGLAWVLTLVAGATWLTALPGAAQAPQPRKGGVLRVAMIGEPPSIDMHWTTATITREIAANVFETLFTFDPKFQPIPHLAEGYEALDGARRACVRGVVRVLIVEKAIPKIQGTP